MKIHLCYPPQAYPFMPHLGIHYLRGFIENNLPGWITSVSDLNIQFHQHIWSENICEQLSIEAANNGDTELALLGELLSQSAPVALGRLRDHTTYDKHDQVAEFVDILRLCQRLINKINKSRNAIMRRLPASYGQWPNLIEQALQTVQTDFLSAVVNQGFFDQYDVVGFSIAYVEQILPAQILSKLIKARSPEKIILFGGAGFTHIERYAMHDLSFWSYVDYGITYEGEYPLKELMRYLSGQDVDVDHIPNLMTRKGQSVLYKQKNSVIPKTYATPNFDGIEDLYPTPEIIYPLLTTKGCYWGKCSYCTHHESYGKGYYAIPNEFLSSGLHALLSKGATSFYFVDEALPLNKVQVLAEFFKNEKKKKNIDIKWIAEARMERTYDNNDFAKILAQSGCRLLINGIESGSPAVLKTMNKGIDLESIVKTCADIRAEGIRVGWMFFIGHPGETNEQANETFAFIRNNPDSVDYVSIGCFSLEMGSPIWNDPNKFKIHEILNKDELYRLDYPFKMSADGEVSDKDILYPTLNKLFNENLDIKKTLTGAIDRAISLFLQPNSSEQSEITENLKTWHSRSLNKEIIFNYHKRQFMIIKGKGKTL